jgi:dihydrofolate synthase/folylpolyglutamate synthase
LWKDLASVPSPIRNLSDAAAYLEGLINVERRPDWPYRRFSLAPIHALLERLGRPDRGLSVLHIAGSKGKGSTVLYAESVLRAGGRTTGTFTSPHLERWTERFRIDGSDVDEAALASAVERVRPHVDALRAESPDLAPTFFDATTAVALLLFAEARVDHVILEVGLGGRLDSTNACQPEVTCVTSIELEHTDRLGDTLAAIAGEKAGIVKAGVPVVVGGLPPEALEVVEARAHAQGAPLVRVDAELRVGVEDRELDGSRLSFEDDGFLASFDVSQMGPVAPCNAALALACVRRLATGFSDEEFEAAARAGLARAQLPGRLEIVSRDPWVVVDGAHTPASAALLAQALRVIGRPVDFVLSVSGDKELDSMLAAWVTDAASVTTTQAESVRSLDACALADRVEALAPGSSVRVEPDPEAAIAQARRRADAKHTLCFAGSIYLAGIARRVLRGLEADEPAP